MITIKDRFEDPVVYKKHHRFWWCVALILAVLIIVGTTLFSLSGNFYSGLVCYNLPTIVIVAMGLAASLLVITLSPAILQNAEKQNIQMVALFLVYCFPILLLCTALLRATFNLPITSFLNLCVVTIAAMFILVVLIIDLGSYDLLKKIAKESLFIMIFGSYILLLVLSIWAAIQFFN